MSKRISRAAPGEVSLEVARQLLRIVDHVGGQRDSVLAGAGLGHVASLLRNDGYDAQALSRHDFARLFAQCTWAIDAVAAWQEGREPLSKLGFDLMCHVVINCRTLEQVIRRIDDYSQILGPRLARLTLRTDGGRAIMEMATIRRRRNVSACFSDLTGLSTYHRLFGWLVGQDLPLTGVQLRYEPVLDSRVAEYLMPHWIVYRSAENALVMPAEVLGRRVVRSAGELDRLLEYFPFDLMQPQDCDEHLSRTIARQMSLALSSGERLPTIAGLARQYGMGAATIKRRLEAEGTSMVQLKREARFGLAQRLLSDRRLTVSAIAQHCQFADPGAFRRAFHQWAGMAPTRWREMNMEE